VRSFHRIALITLAVIAPAPPRCVHRGQQRLDPSPALSVNSPRPTTHHDHPDQLSRPAGHAVGTSPRLKPGRERDSAARVNRRVAVARSCGSVPGPESSTSRRATPLPVRPMRPARLTRTFTGACPCSRASSRRLPTTWASSTSPSDTSTWRRRRGEPAYDPFLAESGAWARSSCSASRFSRSRSVWTSRRMVSCCATVR
jgi:hypothetical protein